MPRITFDWNGGHFCTDWRPMADLFVRSPESFNPSMRGRITEEMRAALARILEREEASPSSAGSEEQIGEVRISVRHPKASGHRPAHDGAPSR